MRFFIALIVAVALLCITSSAEARGRRGCSSCQNGQCAAPSVVKQPTLAKDCVAGCKCREGGECKCGPNCPNGAHASGDACGENRSGFMSRGPVRRGVRGLFGWLFGCRSC